MYDKAPVLDPLVVTIKSAFPIESGHGKYGPWTRISMVVEDETGTINVSWWEPTTTDHQGIIGRQISLRAYDTTQSQGVGCAVTHYQSKRDGQPEWNADGTPLMRTSIKARGRAVTFLSGAGEMPGPAPAQHGLPAPGQPMPHQPAPPAPAAPMPAPRPQQAAQPKPQKPPITESDILDRIPGWMVVFAEAADHAGIKPIDDALIKAAGAFCSTMAINIAERAIDMSPMPVQPVVPEPAQEPDMGSPPEDGSGEAMPY
jgi:hypothetical protein